MVTGRLPESNPYINQKKVPVVKRKYMDRDMAEVSFVRMMRMACGRNEMVVQNAARRPIPVMMFAFM
jgi:hypothetical protein